MADAETWRLSRLTPGDAGTAEPFGLAVLDDLARGLNHLRSERVALYGRHAQYLPCTAGIGVAAAGLYPADGAGVAQDGAANGIQLAADAPTFALNGMLLLLVDGTGAGQARYLADYDGLTKGALVQPDWTTPPDDTTVYRLLVPCLWSSRLLVKAEFQDTAAAAPSALVAPVFYDFPFVPPTSGPYAGQAGIVGTARPPEVHVGVDWDLDNLDLVDDAVQSGYHLARVRSEVSNGMLGAKLWLREAPASGRIRLCACAV